MEHFINNDVIYRPLRKSDYNEIKQIINKSFGLHKYFNNSKVLKTVLKVYLQSCLAEKTFSSIAEKDNKVVGVIFGNTKSDYKIFKHIKPILLSSWYSFVLNVQATIKGDNIDDFKSMLITYSKLLSSSNRKFDGVLTLFAVTEESRGLGVGKKLLCYLRDYLKSTNTHEIYLYTDSSCNVGFYDSQGFSRIGTQGITIISQNKAVEMNVYLYEYTIQ